jgi:predicted nucleic acid-binding protein
MKVQRVYIDTSVIGGCFDPEFSLWSNGLLQDFTNAVFKPVLSLLVTAEVEEAPDVVQAKLTEIMALSPEILQVTTEASVLAKLYQQRQILTPKFYNDGLHIALATTAEVDVLVSWNFKHIVHFNKIRLFNAVNMEAGYKAIQIYSPREVTTI